MAASWVLTDIFRFPGGNKGAILIFFSAKAIVCHRLAFFPVPAACTGGKTDRTGLVVHQKGEKDRCVQETVVAPAEKEIIQRVDVVRERHCQRYLSQWPRQDKDELIRLVQRFAADFIRAT
ncbi:hypothetical protein CI789_18440 [Erwinia persicina]|nr:hypothetical protein CI789_18440 [Erwinia persicina]